ncbi:Nucleoside_transporter [Hexamita inflata]|uniref:Nucleoside transporter n=1 Tax=Hexamita inflata TaxID=28002 RepID=A0AA86NFN8_9EUKA|nr:Nucleoside transporter [Hexamita inflata]CAI9932294.1 Nucleoside transporter [Hexamita inflata]
MKQSTEHNLIFLTLGFGSYLTFYCLIAQTNYWRRFYSDTILTVYSMAYTFAELFGSLIALPLSKKVSPNFFAHIHFPVQIIGLAIIVPLKNIQNQMLKTVLTAIPLLACGLTASLFYPACIACAAQINPILSATLQVGCGVSEIIIQLVEDAITIFFSDSSNGEKYEKSLVLNAVAFYVTSGFILVGCWATWIYFSKKYLGKPNTQKQLEAQKQDLVISNNVANNENNPDFLGGDNPPQVQPAAQQNARPSVTRRIAPLSIALMVGFVVHYAMFPLFALNVPCVYTAKKFNRPFDDWWSLIYLTIYMFVDFIGRMLPMSKKVVKKVSVKVVIAICFFRVSFGVIFPLMSLPKVVMENGIVTKMPFITSDVLSVICIILFAFCNSFTATMGYIKYQDDLDTPAEIERGSFILGVFLQIGQISGNLIGVGMIPIFK